MFQIVIAINTQWQLINIIKHLQQSTGSLDVVHNYSDAYIIRHVYNYLQLKTFCLTNI